MAVVDWSGVTGERLPIVSSLVIRLLLLLLSVLLASSPVLLSETVVDKVGSCVEGRSLTLFRCDDAKDTDAVDDAVVDVVPVVLDGRSFLLLVLLLLPKRKNEPKDRLCFVGGGARPSSAKPVVPVVIVVVSAKPPVTT